MSVDMDMLREELKARLEADEYFTDLTVIDYRKADLVSEIQKLLAGLVKKGGKCGAFVFLEGFSAPPRGTEPPIVFDGIRMNVIAIEVPLFNGGASGTGKTAWDIGLRAAQVMCGYTSDGLTGTITVDRRGVTQVEAPPRAIAYEVPLVIPANIVSASKVATPAIAPADGAHPQAATLTCATTGSAIYYTLDDSHPWSGNTTAHLYSTPVAIAAACALRAIAYKTGMIASDSALGIYT